MALQAGADYELIGGTPPHPNANSHYGVQSLINDIPNIADDWNEWLQGRSGDEGENNTLKVNDMSLVWGGLFDVGQNVNGQLTGNWRRPHQTHREGRDMDVRVWRWNNATGWGVPVGLAPAQDGTRPDYRTNFQDIVDDYNQNAGVVVETDPHHIHVNWD